MPRKKYGNAKYFLTSRSALFWAGVAVLGFSVSVLATSTYAWWKLADLLILDKIQVGYNGSEMFKIGMKNSAGEIEYPNYVDMSSDQTIDNSVLSTYSSFTGNEVLRPVSGMYESLWNNASADPATSYPQFRTGFFGAEDVRKAALAPSSSYLQFEFFFVCDRDVYVYLDGSTSLVANHGETTDSDVLLIHNVTTIDGVTYECDNRIKVSKPSDDNGQREHNAELLAKILRLRDRAAFYLHCPFMRKMVGAKPVHNPLSMTNM